MRATLKNQHANLGSAHGEYWASSDEVFTLTVTAQSLKYRSQPNRHLTLTGMTFTFEIYGNLSFLDWGIMKKLLRQ